VALMLWRSLRRSLMERSVREMFRVRQVGSGVAPREPES
jgi:hypothetical protein